MNRNPPTVRSITFAAAPCALADHNSTWGEDWATDAMDVHDARFDAVNDDTLSGSAFLADSLLETGPAIDTLPGMGRGSSAIDAASGMSGGMGRGR